MRVIDDGGSDSQAPAGLGTSMLDEVALAWSRTSAGPRTVLVVDLATVAS